MNHFVHCCSFSTNKITSKGRQSASKTCDFDAKNAKNFWGGDIPSPHPTPLNPIPIGAFGASILTPPILKFCLRYWRWQWCWLFWSQGTGRYSEVHECKVTRLRKCSDLIREGKVFVENKTKVASRVGCERAVLYFRELLFKSNERMAGKNTENINLNDRNWLASVWSRLLYAWCPLVTVFEV